MTDHASPICVKAIDHVTVIVDDLDRTEKFYGGTLGMRKVPRPDFKFPGLWFQAGTTQVHVTLKHERSAPAGFPVPPGNASPGGTFHFAFEVDDCHAANQALKTAGVRTRGEPSQRPDGCTQLWCYDPDGHVIELFSRPK